MDYSTVYKCRVCAANNLEVLFSLGDQRLSGFLLPGEAPRPYVPLTFVWCDGCHCLQQRHSANPELLHAGTYWYRSGGSDTMREALTDVVSSAAARTPLLPGDMVLDIGSNDGTLLRTYGHHLTRVGVEPMAYSFPESAMGASLVVTDPWGDGVGLQSVQKMFPAKLAKVVTALGMLYSIENPDVFVRDVAQILHPDGIFITQLMTLPDMIDEQDVGNLCHEHLTFPSLECLNNLFQRHGLIVTDMERNAVNGKSTRLYIVRDKGGETSTLNHDYSLWTKDGVRKFYAKAQINLSRVRELLYQEIKEDREVHIYGASTKGNTILQCLGITKHWAKKAADRDERKHGRVTSGGDIPIVSEEESVKDAKTYLLLPYAFKDEIVARLKGLGWSGRMIVPMPRAEVIHV